MLKSLLIENYALIDKLDISFDEGLTIITGETGAGKSILLGALGLILGQRADTRVLHNKESKCIIEGVFSLEELKMESLFEEHELDYEIITYFRREITPQGKSRAFINDTPVNLTILRVFAEKLIDIHSQHQSLMFANSSFRYNLLDSWAGITLVLTKFQKEFTLWLAMRKELEAFIEQEKQTRAELDYFRFQFDELQKAAIVPGELSDIEQELEILNHTGEIKYNLEKANFLLQDSPENILGLLNEVISLYKPLEKYNTMYAGVYHRLESSVIELKDIVRETEGFKEDVVDDPHRASQLQQRYDLLQKLLHKHNAIKDKELLSVMDEFKSRIEGFETLEEDIQNLTLKLETLQKKLISLANDISHKRNDALKGMENQINAVLKELGMPGGQFRVALKKSNELHFFGCDDMEFLFSANTGALPQELSKVASGGELSRLMLAIKSVISIKNLLPTIIFDEIDSGVSGEIGFKVGAILEKIASQMQVISVTHLPQVAARGTKHFLVYKKTENQKTNTYVKQLTSSERVQEIAQMLGGEKPGTAAIQAAEELFDKQNTN